MSHVWITTEDMTLVCTLPLLAWCEEITVCSEKFTDNAEPLEPIDSDQHDVRSGV